MKGERRSPSLAVPSVALPVSSVKGGRGENVKVRLTREGDNSFTIMMNDESECQHRFTLHPHQTLNFDYVLPST